MTAAKEMSVESVTAEIKAFFTQPQVDKAAKQARPDLIAPLGKGTIAITPWQQDLFAAIFKAAEGINKAVEGQRAIMRRMLLDQYGSTAPTYKQFKDDRAALRILAEQKGLVDDQWVRKPYNAALIELYGSLPESDSPAAIAKRAEREAADKAAGKVGAPKGQTTERVDSEADKIEQFIAKHGLAKVLQATARILAAKTESKLDAVALQAVASKYDPQAAIKAALESAKTGKTSKQLAAEKYAQA
jgi:ribosome-associated translation inhibitor RaiA